MPGYCFSSVADGHNILECKYKMFISGKEQEEKNKRTNVRTDNKVETEDKKVKMTAKASLMRNILINKKGNKNDRDIICLSLLFVSHVNLEQTYICLLTTCAGLV